MVCFIVKLHRLLCWIKGTFCDSKLKSFNDMNQKIQKKISKIFSWFHLRLQLTHDYLYWHWHCTIDYCVKSSLFDKTLCKKLQSFHKKMISAQFLWENVLLRGELQIDAINSNFENFESRVFFLGGGGLGGSPHPAKILPIPPHPTLVPVFGQRLVPPQLRFVPENLKNLNTFLCQIWLLLSSTVP